MTNLSPKRLFVRAAACCVAVLTASPAFSKISAAAAPAVTLRMELDRAVLPADTAERAIVKISLGGVRLARPEARPPVNLALVIDRSGSMSGDKIVQARAAALEAVNRLAADDVFSLVAYDTRAETLIPAQRVGDGRRLEAAIRGIRAGGGTALYAGVTQGASELRKHLEDRRYIHRLVLLSDGQANEGPSSPEELGRLGAALMKEGISVTTVGLGLGFNEDLMTLLARKSDGNTYFVEGSTDLPRIFAAELGDVLNVVARRVVLTIDFPQGVRPLTFVGREGRITEQQAEIVLNQLYGGQEKFALLEVEVAPTSNGLRRDVAKARVAFEDPVAGKPVTVDAAVVASFSADRAVVVGSANLKVQADYAENALAVAKDAAVELVDAGRRAEAAALLRNRAAELQTLGSAYANTIVIASARANAVEADRLEREGLDNVARKVYRASNAQVQSQQAVSSGSSGRRP